MSGAWNEAKELWNGIDEVEDLGDKEEQHRLAEVGENTDHSKRHPSKIAERVPHKHSRGIPGNGGMCRVSGRSDT